MLTELEAHKLLYDLCVELGFCLPPEDTKRLKANPPANMKAFIEAVFIAEGLDPLTADLRLYRQVRDMVAAAYWRSEDPGV